MPEETQRATRLRPEEILARSFPVPLGPQSTGGESWSPRARRLFLVALAVAGALLVTAGLLLTGELGPGPRNPTPVETGVGPGAITGSLLPPSDEAQASETTPPTPGAPTPTTAPGPRPRTQSPIVVAPSQTGDAVQPTTPPTQTAVTQAGNSQPQNPTTTVPCSLLGSRSLGAQIPPLCR